MSKITQNLAEYCERNGRGTITNLYRDFRKYERVSYNRFCMWCKGLGETKKENYLEVLHKITGIAKENMFEYGKN